MRRPPKLKHSGIFSCAAATQSKAAEFPSIIFLTVDVDLADDLTGKYDVKNLPTFLFFKDEQLVGNIHLLLYHCVVNSFTAM